MTDTQLALLLIENHKQIPLASVEIAYYACIEQWHFTGYRKLDGWGSIKVSFHIDVKEPMFGYDEHAIEFTADGKSVHGIRAMEQSAKIIRQALDPFQAYISACTICK